MLKLIFGQSFDLDLSSQKVREIFFQRKEEIYRKTDRFIAVILLTQWISGIILAAVFTSHIKTSLFGIELNTVVVAFIVGGIINLIPAALGFLRPGKIETRYAITIGQTLMSSLLHL